MTRLLLAATVLLVSTQQSVFTAQAQQAPNATDSMPLLIRGTTGSGEQEPVFGDTVNEGEVVDDVQPVTSANPVIPTRAQRQMQGRARPVQPAPPVVDPLVTDSPSPRSNLRLAKSQLGTGALPREAPFEALGLRVGTWRVFTNLDQTLGYSTNISATQAGESGGFSQTSGGVSMQSDWSGHSARLEANGTYRHYLDSDTPDMPAANVDAGLTLDLIDGVRVDGQLSYGYATESATSTNINALAVNRPGIHSASGSLGVVRSGNKLSYAIRGSVGRTVYEDVELNNGASESQQDRNNILYAGTMRVGYQASPAFNPFVEGEVARRVHDNKLDRNGEERDSTILAAKTGFGVDISEKLTGEASVGYRVERFESDTLEELSGITLDGNIVWSPVRDTTLTLMSQTDFSGSTTAGQNGAIVSTLGLTAERQVSDRLNLNADAELTVTRQDDGSRTDSVVTVGAGFNYWLNRFMGLTGRVEHTGQFSTRQTQEYDATSAQLGLRLQR